MKIDEDKRMWNNCFTSALSALENTWLEFPNGQIDDIEFNTQFNTVNLSVPRQVGKTEFIKENISRSDLLITRFRPMEREYLRCGVRRDNILNVENIMKKTSGREYCRLGLGHIKAYRFIWMDEVNPTKELIERLYELELVDVDTKIFALRTPLIGE